MASRLPTAAIGANALKRGLNLHKTRRITHLNLFTGRHLVPLLGGMHGHDQQRARLHMLIAGILFLISMPMQANAAGSADVGRGKQLYQHYCAACHGVEGTGTGLNAPYLERMGRAPADHTDLPSMNRLSDAELYRAISEGKRRDGEPPFMPWWGFTLPPDDIWNLVAFIRALAKDTTE